MVNVSSTIDPGIRMTVVASLEIVSTTSGVENTVRVGTSAQSMALSGEDWGGEVRRERRSEKGNK